MASSQCRPCQPRATQGDVGDRELPHGRARRPCRTLRERDVRSHGDRLQLLSQDLLARATAETRAHASSARDQDRHLMMTLMLDICKYDQCLRWLPADNVIPCIVTSMLPFGKTQKRKIALLRRSVSRSQPNSRPCRVAKLRTLPPRSATSTPAPAAKPP
jgi:hypothetical protein